LALEDQELRERLAHLLRRADVSVETLATDEQDWWERAARSDATVVVVRRSQVAQEASREALAELADDRDAPEILVVSDEQDAVERAELLASGAAAVIDTTASIPEIRDALEAVATALAERGVARPETGGSRVEPRLADFRSRSQRMQSFLDIVERIKSSDSSLLIVGETGVGKEHLARAIHAESPRCGGAFVSVNCAAIPEHLLESELFGHEKGAFTGATRERIGCFREAHGGTIFLDEVGDLPKHLQVKLLAVLQRHEVRPVGSDRALPIDVRVIVATNRDLDADVEAGKFREDLYFRLAVVPLRIPPLRERREDLPDLIGMFMRHFRSSVDREDVNGITPEAMEALLRYSWPGNVRELINVIERATLLCRGLTITRADLPEPLGSLPPPAGSADTLPLPRAWDDRPFHEVKKEVLDRFERKYLRHLLDRTGGRIGESAKLAGVAERTLYEKMKRLGLRKEDFHGV
jgi:DNA-binding NtrC family response regulator